MKAASLVTLRENVLAAIDVETTGRDPGWNEVIQVAVVPLDCNIKPAESPFYMNIRPDHPERMAPEAIDTHGITLEELENWPSKQAVAEQLWEWFQKLNLVPGKRLIPLAHNCQFDVPFIQSWLGLDQFYEVFGYPTRDTQSLITGMQDKAAFKGSPIPFNRASLSEACKAVGVQLDGAHDALADALATAALYRALLARGAW